MICSSAKDKIISYRNRYNQTPPALKNKTRTQNYIRDLAVGTADRQGYKDSEPGAALFFLRDSNPPDRGA